MPEEKEGLSDEFALRSESAQRSSKSETPNFRKIIEDIARRRSSPFEVFSDFVRMAACALASQTREEEYLEVAGRYSKEELEQFSKALAELVSEM